MSLETSYSLENSDMSKLMSASLLPNRYSASVLASVGLSRTRGAQEDERTARTTRILERLRLRRMALATAATASSWPMMRVLRALSHASRRRLSSSVRDDGNARRHGHDIGDLRHIDDDGARVELRGPGGAGLAQGDFGRLHPLLELSSLVHVVGSGRLLHTGLELGHARLRLANRLGGLVAGNASTRTGLVHEVNRLIGQEAVLDVAVRQVRGGLERRGRVPNMMMLFVFGGRVWRESPPCPRRSAHPHQSPGNGARKQDPLARCLRNSSAVVAPMIWKAPRASTGLSMELASMEPLCGTGADERVHLIDK